MCRFSSNVVAIVITSEWSKNIQLVSIKDTFSYLKSACLNIIATLQSEHMIWSDFQGLILHSLTYKAYPNPLGGLVPYDERTVYESIFLVIPNLNILQDHLQVRISLDAKLWFGVEGILKLLPEILNGQGLVLCMELYPDF